MPKKTLRTGGRLTKQPCLTKNKALFLFKFDSPLPFRYNPTINNLGAGFYRLPATAEPVPWLAPVI